MRWAAETSRPEGQRKNTATARRMIMETQRRKFRQRRIPVIFDLTERPEEEHGDGEENKLHLRRRRLAVRFRRRSHFGEITKLPMVLTLVSEKSDQRTTLTKV
nr:hypothetical protein Iba_chr05cCG12000 [Ipomoea batatas]